MRVADFQAANHRIVVTQEVSHILQMAAVGCPGMVSYILVRGPLGPLLRMEIVKEDRLWTAFG